MEADVKSYLTQLLDVTGPLVANLLWKTNSLGTAIEQFDSSTDWLTQYHNDTRGDARYYTKTLLDAGQLDNRYYTETEIDNTVVPITTKGDLLGFSTVNARLGIGTDTYVLTADAASPLGFKWAVGGGGGGVTGPPDTKGDLWSFDSATNNFPVGVNGYPLVPDSTQAFGLKYGTNELNLGDLTSSADTTINFLGLPVTWNNYSGALTWDRSAREFVAPNSVRVNPEVNSAASTIYMTPTYVGQRFDIASSDSPTKTFTVTGEGDLTGFYTVGLPLEVLGTIAGFNDGLYTVASSSYSDPVTSIVVNEAVGLTFGAGGTIGKDFVSQPASGVFRGEIEVRNGAGRGIALSGFFNVGGSNWKFPNASNIGLYFGVKGATVSGTDGDATNLSTVGARLFSMGASSGGTFNFNTATALDIIHIATSTAGTNNGTTATGLNIEDCAQSGVTVNLTDLYQLKIAKPTTATNNFQVFLLGADAGTGIFFDSGTNRLYSDGTDLIMSGGNLQASFQSSDGSAGVTQTGSYTNFTIKDGIITAAS